MAARQVVLLTSPNSFHLPQLLSRQQSVPVTVFGINTYSIPTSVHSRELTERLSPLDATLTRNRGEGCLRSYQYIGTLPRLIPFVCHSYENCRGRGYSSQSGTRLTPFFRVIVPTGPTSVLRIRRSRVRRFLLFSGAFRLSAVDSQPLLPWLFTGHGARGTFSEGFEKEAQTRGNETCVAPAAQQAESRTGAKDWRCKGDGPCTRNASR